MAIGIGYNVDKANTLMAQIASAYDSLGKTIGDNWSTVSASLRDNWIGEDELYYEENVVDRINKMYQNAYNLANIAVGTIEAIATAWWDFQKKNIFDDPNNKDGISSMGEIKLNVPTITKNESILTFTSITIDNTTDRGLKSASSAATIKGTIENFVEKVKTTMSNLIDLDVANAFFGEQTEKIKQYLEHVANAMVEVTLAIKDLYNALDSLAKSRYTEQSSSVSTFAGDEMKTVDAKINDKETGVGSDTRWGSSSGVDGTHVAGGTLTK